MKQVKTKNGFTLIELLAIIVILAIIAVITVPIILNIIENSRVGAVQDSAYGYKDAISKYYVTKLSENSGYNMSGTYTTDELKTLGVTVSGQEPTEGWAKLEKGQIVDYSLKFDDYVVNLNESTNQAEVTKNGDIETSPANWFTYSSNGDSTVSITGFNTSNYDGSVTDIIIPKEDETGNTVTAIANSFNFNGITLTSIVFPNSIKTIGHGCFSSLTSLKKISFSEGLESIGQGSFLSAIVEELVIPDTVTMLGTGSFSSIYTLKTLYLGSSLTTIQPGVFALNWGDGELSQLKTVYNKSNIDLSSGYFANRTGYTIINQ